MAGAGPPMKLFDAFADAKTEGEAGAGASGVGGVVHIRIQQRNGRKTLTTVQGLSDEYDKKRIVRALKKQFACNGTVVDHSEYGEVIQLQGDQRNNVCQFLTTVGLVKEEQLKIHGF
ncbi:eukaryotic translation initiation factor 1b-like [Sycon ciliatum]|uniref:eukaryotic translation initiation factor 1b-like n=1 Tax=Sycon ciliatum TaxID=27933 RepID=UPI0020AD0C42|eukprot:scpid99747/ scgid26483/ Protein translation factor SUI1 homolog